MWDQCQVFVDNNSDVPCRLRGLNGGCIEVQMEHFPDGFKVVPVPDPDELSLRWVEFQHVDGHPLAASVFSIMFFCSEMFFA